jgi:hypothetical protein
MKTVRFILVYLLLGLMLAGCSRNTATNPEPKPDPEPAPGPSQITRDDFEPEGDITQTATGYSVDGKLLMTTKSGKTVVFKNANLTLEFNADGLLSNMTGTTEIPSLPSPVDFIEYTKTVQADIGFFSGKFLNENRDFEILLKEDTSYFVFHIRETVEMQVDTSNGSGAFELLTLQPAENRGYVLFIADFNDPMFYFSGVHDALGIFCFGTSAQGRIPYIPSQPLEVVGPFDGRSIRCGTFTFYKVIGVTGTLVKSIDFDASLIRPDPIGTSIEDGFRAGLNGAFSLSLGIENFGLLNVPISEASGAIVAVPGPDGNFVGKASINSVAGREEHWWPDFLPVKSGIQSRSTGFIMQDGTFSRVYTGEFHLQLPSRMIKFDGEAQLTNEDFTIAGSVVRNDLTWAVAAALLKNQTEYVVKQPEIVLSNINTYVDAEIDSVFDDVERARQDLEQAIADYEFELSLRGLRASLPTIVSEAKSRLSSGLRSAETKARNQIESDLDENGLKLCSDNLNSVINGAAAPYFSALDRLQAAAKETQDNDRTRSEIEATLRDVASRKRLNRTVSVTLKVANKIIGCGVTSTQSRNVSIDVQILPDAQVNQLLTAANDVKYIAETSDLRIKAQQIFDSLPSTEKLEQLRADLQSGVRQIPDVGEEGFIYTYQDKTYAFFIVLDGKRHEVSEFDLFSGSGVGAAVVSILTQGN